jgi:hypothetical protein
MKLQRVICRILFVALGAAAAVSADAAVRLSVTADSRNQPNPDGKAPPGGTQQSEVVLADTYISSRTGDKTIVYDFAQRRRYVFDETSKTYDEFSLFDVVGFRELELHNRDAMHKALAAAKVDNKKLESQLEDEHELAIPGATPNPVTMRTDGGDEVFLSGDVTLLRRSKDGTPVSAPDAARFVQFLRYTFAGHPGVLAALQKEQQIPGRLSYSFHPAWGASTVELKISAVRQIDAPAALPLAGYTPRPPAASAASLDDLVDRAWASRSALAAKVSWPQTEALAARMRAQRPLDAFLTMTEAQLSVGRIPEVTDEQKAAFRTDPAIQALARALSAKDQNAMRQAVGALGMLQLQAQSRRYLLSLYEANDRAKLGEAIRARTLFADVLQANPSLAGAYKDIGDFYFLSFDTPRAWRSWEIARTLAPLYPSLGAVTQYERSLVTRFPEYF